MDRLQQTMALLATTFGLFLLLLPQVQCQTAGTYVIIGVLGLSCVPIMCECMYVCVCDGAVLLLLSFFARIVLADLQYWKIVHCRQSSGESFWSAEGRRWILGLSYIPHISPPCLHLAILDAGACNGVDCQQGQCVVLSNNSYPTNILSPYKCQCNPGWTTMESLVTGLPLLLTLPCTVPNCKLFFLPELEVLQAITMHDRKIRFCWFFCNLLDCLSNNNLRYKAKLFDVYKRMGLWGKKTFKYTTTLVFWLWTMFFVFPASSCLVLDDF